MSLVTLVKDEEMERLHPARWPARVAITTNSGAVYSRRTDFPRGDPENPVAAGELVAKFHMLADGPWGKEKTALLEEAALSLESVKDVRNLFNKKGAI